MAKRRKYAKKGRRRGGATKKILNFLGSAGAVLKKAGLGREVKSARNIVSKGALGMLKRKMATM